MPPEQQDPAGSEEDLDRILSEHGPRDVVFHGLGMFRPWDLSGGPKDLQRTKPRGGFHWASY